MDRKKNYIGGITIVLLALSILLMSIGFAIRSQRLDINGNTTIGVDPKWDIHFSNVNITEGSVNGVKVISPAKIVNANGTYVTYDVKLPLKGEFYEFTVDIVNEGNLDAKISNIILNNNKDYSKYLKYTFEYVNPANQIAVGDILLSGEARKIKVRVENIYELNPYELGEITFEMGFALQYEQK